ncbi:MAG TPA: DUF309 domain-containing protein [Polyangia bacterium]|nr:DUF309 domain-containing protein [Polyangia bacterium]
MGELPGGWLERLEPGRLAFNRGAYFEAHELWEDVWHGLDAGARPVERLAVQGLIQIAAGLHHLQQSRPRPAAQLLRKGVAKLSVEAFPAVADLRVGALQRDVARLLVQLQAPAGSKLPDPGSIQL